MMIKKQIPISILILAVLLLLLATLPVASATTTTIQPSSADSSIYKEGWIKHGTDNYMYISPLGDYERRGIVTFDLSSIPSGAQVTSATLYLHERSAQGTSRTIGVHRLTNSWTEAAVTWNSRIDTDNWGTAGGDFISTATDEQLLTWTWFPKWDSWDVTSDIRGFVNGTHSNYGWIVKDETERDTADYYWQFHTKEYATESLRPKLEVTYSLVTSCNSTGVEVNQFAPGEKVYVMGEGLAASTNYTIWIQDDAVSEGDPIVSAEDPSTTSPKNETAKTDAQGNFSATLIWSINASAPVTNHGYDIVADNLESGTVGTYNTANDGLDSASVAGIVAPVPDVSALVLFASGLMLAAVCFVYGRGKKEERKQNAGGRKN